MISRLATAFALLGVIVVAPVESGCGNCSAGCLDGNLTFHLAHPIQAQALTIVVTVPSGGSDPAYCVASAAGFDCSGTSPVRPHAAAPGSLQSVESPFFGTGAYRIEINVDGAWVVDQTFQYTSGRDEGLCGSSCYPGATFEIQN